MGDGWIEVDPGDTVTGETDAVSAGPDANGNCKSYKWIDCFDAETSCDDAGNLSDPKLKYVGNKNTEGKGWKEKICCASERLSNDQQEKKGGWKNPKEEHGKVPPGCK
jgi:hypothetical protein